MDVRTDEIGDRIYRISTFLPQAQGGAGFTFNQFLIDAEELRDFRIEPLPDSCAAAQ